MGKYLDRLVKARFTGEVPSECTDRTDKRDCLESFDGFGSGHPGAIGQWDCDPLGRMLAEYRVLLVSPDRWEGRKLPPTPPFRCPGPAHAAAWAAWWDAVELLRTGVLKIQKCVD